MIKVEDLKVGMKVKLRDNLEHKEDCGNVYWISRMKKGCIVTIRDFIGRVFEIEDCRCFYTPDMIERIVK